MSKQVAQTILKQMGGVGKLQAMIGAKQFVSLNEPPGVQFGFSNRKGPNKVVIKLNGKDLYDVEFWKIKKFDFNKVDEANDVYAEHLKSVFEEATGLYLSL